jgi:hypothetical protein
MCTQLLAAAPADSTGPMGRVSSGGAGSGQGLVLVLVLASGSAAGQVVCAGTCVAVQAANVNNVTRLIQRLV